MSRTGPLPGEIVWSKRFVEFFNGTAIDQILHNLGIQDLIVAGWSPITVSKRLCEVRPEL
ncbi:MAG: hypothetical protein U0401_11855 [Anaerolineae bacterium]